MKHRLGHNSEYLVLLGVFPGSSSGPACNNANPSNVPSLGPLILFLGKDISDYGIVLTVLGPTRFFQVYKPLNSTVVIADSSLSGVYWQILKCGWLWLVCVASRVLFSFDPFSNIISTSSAL
jgi:hypothetical protein